MSHRQVLLSLDVRMQEIKALIYDYILSFVVSLCVCYSLCFLLFFNQSAFFDRKSLIHVDSSLWQKSKLRHFAGTQESRMALTGSVLHLQEENLHL